MIELIELGNECELITKGSTPTTLGKNFTSQGISFLRAQNVINSNVLIDEDILFIDSETHNKELKRSQIFDGDVLLTIAGTIGRTAIVKNIDNQLNCNQAVAVIRLGNSKINKEYLCHFIASPLAQEQFFKGIVTATIPNLSLAQIRKLQIPLPPLPQQQKIANILDAADELRQNDKKLIAKYDELTQALFLDMFGDPVSNPKGWEKIELKNLGKVITGSTPSSSKENMFGGSIPFVTPGDLDKNEPYKRFVTRDGALNSRTVNKGSLFVCCIGATIGKSGIAREWSAFNQQINSIEWDNKINSLFGYSCFTYLKKELIEKAISTTLPIMKKSEFEKLKMICPSIELQNKFAERVEFVAEQKAIAQKSLDKSEDLFNSLLQKAFNGELV